MRKLAASKKAGEAAAAEKALRAAEAGLASAQAELTAAGHAVETAVARAHRAGASRQVSSGRQGRGRAGQARCGQAGGAVEVRSLGKGGARAAGRVHRDSQAHDAAEEAQLDLSPVSVFISRKTQRLYIRKNNMPVFEAPVTSATRISLSARSCSRLWSTMGHPAQCAGTWFRCTRMRRISSPPSPPRKAKPKSLMPKHRPPTLPAHRPRFARLPNAGSAGAHLGGGAAGLVADHFGRRSAQRNGQGHRFHRGHERRTARRPHLAAQAQQQRRRMGG